MAVVVVGMVLTAGSHPAIRINLDTKIVERGVELTLAILLFVDATLFCIAGATATHTPASKRPRTPCPRCSSRSARSTEDVGTLLSLCVWFVFGRAVDDVLDAGVSFQVIAYAVLALTVVRILPVLLALRGTTITRIEAIVIGWMGPRGLASLVFGLLAVIELKGSPSSLTAQVMVITVSPCSSA